MPIDDPERLIAQALLAAPGFLLARIDQIATMLYARHGGCETLAQGELLLAVAALDRPTQVEVGAAAGVDKSTTGYVLDKLEARGLVRRSGDPGDRRRVRLDLTDAGHAALPRTGAAFAELQQCLHDAAIGPLRRIAADADGLSPRWSPPPSLAHVPSLVLRRALQVFQARFAHAAAPWSLTTRQFSLLFILTMLPRISQAGFSRLFGLDPATCGVVLRNLARRGLVVSAVVDHDRRTRLYSITAAGAAAASAARPPVDASQWGVFASEEERSHAVAALQRLVLRWSPLLRFPGAVALLDSPPASDSMNSDDPVARTAGQRRA